MGFRSGAGKPANLEISSKTPSRRVMTSLGHSISTMKFVLVAAALLACTQPARAEYRLQGGDVVEISVAGVSELKQRAPVQFDGSITLPLVGTLMVEGMPFSEIRNKIQSAVAGKIFRIRTADGRELARVFERDEVAAAIVEYRPVFVIGDVSRPGEHPFRPRLTVRQALAAAGGVSAQVRANITSLEVANLRSEYITVWLNVAREHVRIWSIKTELGENIELDSNALSPAPVSVATLSEILSLAIESRKLRDLDHERAKDFLRRSIREADEQIKILSEQRQDEREGYLADVQELQKARAAFGGGNLPSPRVAEFRRAVLYSSTRQLQVTSQIIQVKRARAETARELEKIDDQRGIRLLAEMQDATVRLTGERAKLQSAEEKLQLAGLQPLRPSDTPGKPEITVFRGGANGTERLSIDTDSELQPGDVVEVALRGIGTDVASR
jgi:polysaccharide export outer membrane protein